MEKVIMLLCVFGLGFAFGAQWMSNKAKEAFAKVLEEIEEELQNKSK